MSWEGRRDKGTWSVCHLELQICVCVCMFCLCLRVSLILLDVCESSPSEDDSRTRERWPLRGHTESGPRTDEDWFSEDPIMAWWTLWRVVASTTQTPEVSMARHQRLHSSKCRLPRCGSWPRSNCCWLWPDTLIVTTHSLDGRPGSSLLYCKPPAYTFY